MSNPPKAAVCKVCGAVLVPLFTSLFCPNEGEKGDHAEFWERTWNSTWRVNYTQPVRNGTFQLPP